VADILYVGSGSPTIFFYPAFDFAHGLPQFGLAPSRLLNRPSVSSRISQLRRQLSANPQRDCKIMSYGEDDESKKSSDLGASYCSVLRREIIPFT
jgi:hypothetical protein